MLRTVKFWVRYRPKSGEVIELRRFKHELAQPSRASADVIFQCSGHYVRQSGKDGEHRG